MKVRDIDIRQMLHKMLANEFKDTPDTIIIDELQVCYGSARADVVAINGSLYGYEIKSESDTLERLSNQVYYYDKVFDYIYLVCSDSFSKEIEELIPEWWGIYIASKNTYGELVIEKLREANQNKKLEGFSLAQFLWKDELLDILVDCNLDKNIKKLPKYVLWQYLADFFSIEDIQQCVKSCLKSRMNWRNNSLYRLHGG